LTTSGHSTGNSPPSTVFTIFATEMIYFGFLFKDTWEDLLAVIADAGWLIALIAVSLWIIKRLLRASK
jgi:hypothetical protein